MGESGKVHYRWISKWSMRTILYSRDYSLTEQRNPDPGVVSSPNRSLVIEII